MNKDIEKISLQNQKLRFCLKLYITCIIIMFINIFLIIAFPNFFKNNDNIFATVISLFAFLTAISAFILRFVLVFRVRFVLDVINKKSSAILWQLGVLLIPLGEIIIPNEVLKMSETYLKSDENIKKKLSVSIKKCTKCGKEYDNSWTICLNCSIPLINT